ncbi:Delta(7)-sterol 5(6)-desaturase erg32 [Schizosaccharomyces pombe]|uniref:Delta(7)-sterol 5(6)-desaturase erg32 n=1 Tax=Schizosaccharomyces pombe (strain 972 / ATCC 24843) TaxID=284812 RepID=ERG3B_SCHPO|nr:C-5 sterol desaturase Erg32 [Schizosaccharomyces pombe]O13666.1 RecName: Full=Delta(7)-sterol 5(6)-desaturase erg32; AltName: Full=C-5 sterol desaturase erg32; AltName: Full=Ergosterol Delta(5,6) desaturase erg32; AltName: Full=Ergosterol biosynthetic protein 32; AltName: Full=Sterol-C5-desaturase erg32 [Schizosaccharomyces pombe 972h-]BAA21457.1 C-5 STEROL DESATURASE [Schizosaccharomyces pombe]CAA16898.1 C-5 sterol desaturase Erg32 [Schizosaccharomyces pombe]|eukprot:NP_001018791.2 C-5 sterol desaturase Erg32 [Schizosaccharomyces pombe]
MDVVLQYADKYVFDTFYGKIAESFDSSSSFANTAVNSTTLGLAEKVNFAITSGLLDRNNVWRQFTSLFLITWIMGTLSYFLSASFAYYVYFDREEARRHPKFLKNQEHLELMVALKNLPGMAILTAPWFLAEIRGYGYVYDKLDEYGYFYLFFSIALFLLFSDFLIYWIHRALHHRWLYAPLHKLHHKWIVPTPYSSHAFHYLDGYSQSLPYHMFPFFFPLNKYVYLLLFGSVNYWTVLIHDGKYFSNNAVVNGAAHHAAHHMYFNYNYGQFFTLFDRLCSSYRQPDQELFDAELRNEKLQEQRIRFMETVQYTVEGKDDRTYASKKDN